jgi:acyl carrier protein
METIELLRKLMEENLDIDRDEVTPDATLESLGVDSLDLVELVSDLEEELDIEFGEPEGLDTIGKMVSYIDELRD